MDRVALSVISKGIRNLHGIGSSTGSDRSQGWPLIGRDDERRAIDAAYASGEAPAAVIVGEAGTGKTRLAAEAAAGWEAEGAHVARVHGTHSSSSVPFGAVSHLIPDGPPPAERLGLIRIVVDALAKQAGDARAVLLVDDAHLLDPGASALVLDAAESGKAFVLATVRRGEPCEDAITKLWKDAGAPRLDLGPLGPADAGEMVEAVLGGPVDGGTIDRLFELSDGNPLWIRELVLGEFEAGGLAQIDGLWRTTGKRAPSEKLTDLIDQRLVGLEPAERRALALLGLVEPLDSALLEELTGDQALIEPERRGLIKVEPGEHGLIRFSHPLYGEVTRATMPAAEARSLRHDLAAVYEKRGLEHHQELLAVARWQLEGDMTRNRETLLRGAQAADRVFEFELAAELASAAIEGGAGLDAAIVLGGAKAGQNRFEEADQALAPYEAEASTSEHQTKYVQERFNLLEVSLGRIDEAQALLDRVRDWRDDRQWRQQLRGWQATILFDQGRFEEAAEHGVELLEGDDVDVLAMLTAACSVTIAYMLIGETRRARELSEPAVGPAIEHIFEQREVSWLALAGWVGTSLETAHDWDALEGFNAIAREGAALTHSDALLGLLELSMARLAINRGVMGTALRKLQEASVLISRSDPRSLVVVNRAMLARAHATLGELDAARADRERAEQESQRRTLPWLDRIELVRADIWIAVAAGQLSQAREIAIDAAGRFDDMPLHKAQCLHEALRLGEPDAETVERLLAVAARVDGELTQGYATHAAALLDGDGARLEDAAANFERLGAVLLAAEAAAQAASAHQEAGREDSARRMAVKRDALAELTEGARTPALAGPTVDELTVREREIAMLVASGFSNQEIATRLVLSRRTVESHLYRVFAKLGLQQREELKALLG